MTTKAQRNLVDSQWNEQAIVWGQEAHGRERSLIYPMLEGGETIQGLVGCAWGPARVFSENSSWIVRKAQLRGVAVATDVQVLLLAKKGLNRCVTRLPFDSITAVECDGAVVTITGDGVHNWAGPGQDDPFQVREVNSVNADRFARLVDELRTSPHLGRHIAHPRRQLCWHEQSRTHQRPVAGPGARRGRAGPVGTLDGQILCQPQQRRAAQTRRDSRR